MTAYDAIQTLGRGVWFDLVTASFVLIPIALIFWLVRKEFWQRRAGRIFAHFLMGVFAFILLFDAVAEHLFWTEFSTRFNFIAVDYLIYTQEVIGNITESYPIVWIIFAIALAAFGVAHAIRRYSNMGELPAFKLRSTAMLLYALWCVAAYSASNLSQAQYSNNAEAGEVAANGIYNLFYAFWHNEINYERFYAEHDAQAVTQKARALLEEDNVVFEDAGLTRMIKPAGKERHKNVMIIAMESMSAEYMASFGNTQNLTPNLDRLAKEGLFFTQLYATGTRTVRGLEAITLSIPPTPGQSIIRRPNNENLFSLGFIFKDRGYDTRFIYGGYGYFDNMNAFFSGNGFDIIDRTKLTADEIHFANVWGVVDDDMFARAIREADASYAAGKPFMHLIMTTTNHRPYTYPEGKVDIAPKTGRLGGVQYADYAIGKLIEWAKEKPWFNDTVFVFVADHTAGAGGKAELAPAKYHIPMIFYSPGFIKPQRFDAIASQIDLAPILLGQLNFHYHTKFYGEDLLHDEDEIPHAFISNYQKVALVKENELTVLSPKQRIQQLAWPDAQTPLTENDALLSDTIGYYQSASWWRDNYRRIPTVINTP